MPWTSAKFPVSMKNLTTPVRNKAIQIANALLKKDKKMKEGEVIATAIKNAKAALAKKTKTVKVVAKKKVAVKKASAKKIGTKTPIKAASKKKVVSKKAVVSVKKKAKVVAGGKAKVTAKSSTKVIAKKKAINPAKKIVKPNSANQSIIAIKASKKKIVSNGKRMEPKEVVADSFIIEPLIPIEEAQKEDLHFIPKEGDVKPIDPIQIHNFENTFHNREEVAMRQENKKVNDAKASRKSYKRTYRMNGNR